MPKHTPGPWVVHIDKSRGNWVYNIRTEKPHNPSGGLGKHIAECNGLMEARGENNAEHIVACVNACAGINPEAVPELVKACEAIMPHLNSDLDAHEPWVKEIDALAAALAKAKGGAS